MTRHPKRRKFRLDMSKIKTLEDLKKIIGSLGIVMDSDDPFYEELKEYFTYELVPRGYILLLKNIGQEEMNKLHYEEIEEKCRLILEDPAHKDFKLPVDEYPTGHLSTYPYPQR